MWNNIFFSKEESDLREIFRSEAWEARDVSPSTKFPSIPAKVHYSSTRGVDVCCHGLWLLARVQVVQGETVASMALSGALLAFAEGIVFRGTGLALSADFFAGISSFPIADPQQASADLLHLQVWDLALLGSIYPLLPFLLNTSAWHGMVQYSTKQSFETASRSCC